jgi:hypothetical protein
LKYRERFCVPGDKDDEEKVLARNPLAAVLEPGEKEEITRDKTFTN